VPQFFAVDVEGLFATRHGEMFLFVVFDVYGLLSTGTVEKLELRAVNYFNSLNFT
jgi:hypothetical protein